MLIMMHMVLIMKRLRTAICFIQQKTSYEVRISDWSSDVCSSDLVAEPGGIAATAADNFQVVTGQRIVPRNLALIERRAIMPCPDFRAHQSPSRQALSPSASLSVRRSSGGQQEYVRSEEHTSELQSLMRNSYAVFCLKKKTQ